MVPGGAAFLVHQVLDGAEARGAELVRATRLSASATSAALRGPGRHGLAERGRGGCRRGDADLDAVATSTGAADAHRERADRYGRDRESWRAAVPAYRRARWTAGPQRVRRRHTRGPRTGGDDAW